MTGMTPERWQRMKGVLYEALELPSEKRAEFLDRVCSGEDSLRREVDSMLSSGDQSCSNFLQSSTPRVPLSSGTKLGHYEIQSLLGAGGMGEVYRGHDPRLGRDVAVKVLPHLFSGDPERLRRFEQEGRAAAALNHPNILAIYDVGTTKEGIPYVVSELLDGETLRQCLRRGPLPMRRAVDLALQMAKGLAAAHDKGIIHRDLKPENLFLTKDGHLKILDFGLAKLVDSRAASPNARTLTRDTTAGAMMGTVGYMPPEQVRGLAIDQRSDIFAAGAVVYEMLSGKRAFQGETTADTIDAILNRDPRPLRETNPTVLPAFERVVQRCLEKNPNERFHSVRDVAFAIEALTDLPSTGQHAVFVRGLRWLLWARWAGVVALVLAAVGSGWYLRRSFLASGQRASSPPLEVRALTESGTASRIAASPDGHYVAYVNRDSGKFELRLLQVATQRDVQVLPGSPLFIRSLHFSPDGNFIYFLRELDPGNDDDLGVFRVATLGGPATLLATDARGLDARFNSVTVAPDGKQIAYLAREESEIANCGH
jgi:serine/threonine protein kinase